MKAYEERVREWTEDLAATTPDWSGLGFKKKCLVLEQVKPIAIAAIAKCAEELRNPIRGSQG